VTRRSSITHYWLLSTHRLFALANVDASPHTNYLFRFLKSDLRAWRRQKRNFNRDLRFVNPFETSEVEDFRIPGPPTLWPASRSKAAQFSGQPESVNSELSFAFFSPPAGRYLATPPLRRPRSLTANRRVSTANFRSLSSLFRRGVILRRRPFEGRAV